MDLTVERLFASPDHYHFAFEGDQAVFRTMDRDAYRRSIFLDHRIAALDGRELRMPVAPLNAFRESQNIAAPRTAWIFHVAHCGSTLLARGLDRPDGPLVLREPRPFRQLGLMRAQRAGGGEGWDSWLKLAAALAGRRYRPEAPTIVKANVPVNFILPELLAPEPDAPAILLYFPLVPYLQAILRSPAHRNWVVNITTQLEPLIAGVVGSLAGLDVAERAAALWLAQMHCYAEALARFAGTRSLHADALFGAPGQALAASAAHFGGPMDEAECAAIVAGALFATYSKSPGEAFDNAARLSLRAETAQLAGPEIARARAWVEGRLDRCPIPARLDRPLVGESPALLGD
jgi:hypothetical protein